MLLEGYYEEEIILKFRIWSFFLSLSKFFSPSLLLSSLASKGLYNPSLGHQGYFRDFTYASRIQWHNAKCSSSPLYTVGCELLLYWSHKIKTRSLSCHHTISSKLILTAEIHQYCVSLFPTFWLAIPHALGSMTWPSSLILRAYL
jgi:hypothetical protein